MEMEDATNRIALATFNIRTDIPDDGPEGGPFRWSTRVHLVKQVVAEHQWDVIGFQEVRSNQLADLLTMTAYDYTGLNRSDDEWGEYNPILYKKDRLELLSSETKWLSPTPDTPSQAHEWGAADPRIYTLAHFRERDTDREFYVLNTHFDHIGEEARFQSAQQLLRVLEGLGEEPVFVMGDFNGGESERYYQALTTRLTDSVAVSPHHVGPHVTCTGVAFEYRPSWDEMMYIDFIFVSPNVQVLKTETVTDQFRGYYPSDHFPVSLWCQI